MNEWKFMSSCTACLLHKFFSQLKKSLKDDTQVYTLARIYCVWNINIVEQMAFNLLGPHTLWWIFDGLAIFGWISFWPPIFFPFFCLLTKIYEDLIRKWVTEHVHAPAAVFFNWKAQQFSISVPSSRGKSFMYKSYVA